ncbi:FimB/Mfa2 family fimbrial subunit, partial [Alistipes sp. OttesenSCG-928-B03]|nr:FimB/Mfa2 family fimbrial subunit [Alistipes sp. OttesenSCG-928-B03]
MKKIHVLLILLACGLIVPGFSSCTKENMDECPVQLTVIAKPEILETYPQRYVIDSIVVYVFDAEDRFVTSKQGGAYTPGGEYVFDIDLDPGSYTFLAWTNAGDYYKSTHSLEQCYAEKPSLSEMKTYLQYPQDGRILEDIPELH